MQKQTVVIIFVFTLILIGVSGTYVLVKRFTTDHDSGLSTVQQTEETSKPTKESELQVQGQSTLSEQPQSQTIPLSAPQQSTNQQRNNLPTPEQFSVYEQYANNNSALYIDIQEGTGEEAVTGSQVAIVYQGWLTNGQLFDQSRINENNQIEPFVFQIGSGQVIPGWDQAISGMKVGGTRRLIIPPSVGYGTSGQGTIPPNSVLIFDVQFAQIVKS